jgi:hypothetical protein
LDVEGQTTNLLLDKIVQVQLSIDRDQSL